MWIIPLLANRPAAAMRLGCRCCHSTSILGVNGVYYSAPNVAGTHVNARASADAALCAAASIVMSLLQQIPEKYHDHDDVHIKLAQCTARKESKSISKIEYLGYICKIIRSKLISFEFSSQRQETNSENTNQETDSPWHCPSTRTYFIIPVMLKKLKLISFEFSNTELTIKVD